MADLTLLEYDMFKTGDAKSYPNLDLDAKKAQVTVTLKNVDKDLTKKLKDNPLLQQKLVDAGSDALKKRREQFEKQLSELNKEFPQFIEKHLLPSGAKIGDEVKKKLGSDAEKIAKLAAGEAETAASKAITDAWAKMKAAEKELAKYKVTVGAKCLLGVGLSTAALTLVTGGAGLVIGAIAAVRTGLTIGTEIKERHKEMNKQVLEIKQKLEKLDKEYEAGLKGWKKVKDVTWDAFVRANLTGMSKLLHTTVDSVGDNVKSLRRKLSDMDSSATKLAKELDKALKDAKEAEKKLGTHVPTLFTKAEKQIADLVKQTSDLNSAVSDAVKWCDEVDAKLKEYTDLKTKVRGTPAEKAFVRMGQVAGTITSVASQVVALV